MSSADPTPELAEIEAIIGAIDRDSRQAAQERADSDERRAVEARAGRIGPDWQEVQRRIDAGETTVEDVFTGRDETPAARRLVETSQRNLAELGELMRTDDRAAEELAEVDRELAQWDPPVGTDPVPPADGSPAAGVEPTPGVRSATDPTAGADGRASEPSSEVPDAPDPGPSTSSSGPSRDPVADRVDATGIAPPEPTEPPEPTDAAEPRDDGDDGDDG